MTEASAEQKAALGSGGATTPSDGGAAKTSNTKKVPSKRKPAKAKTATGSKRGKLGVGSENTNTPSPAPDSSSNHNNDEHHGEPSHPGRSRAVGVSSQAARVNAAVADNEPDGEKLYCICKLPYDSKNMMIACDICDEWYHSECLNISDAEVVLFNMFVCPSCQIETGRKTTLKKKCARKDCIEAAQALSKFCSDVCGVREAADRLEKSGHDPFRYWNSVRNAKRTEGVITRVRDTENQEQEQQHQTQRALMGRKTLETSLAKVLQERRQIEEKVSIIKSRMRLLSLVVEQWERKCAAVADAEQANDNNENAEQNGGTGEGGSEGESGKPSKSKSKRTKRKKKQTKIAPTSLPNAPCGFDSRLSWDDEQWVPWIDSKDGQHTLAGEEDGTTDNYLCDKTRKACERHSGWAKTREADFEVEKGVLTRRLDRLADDERALRTKIEDWDEQPSTKKH